MFVWKKTLLTVPYGNWLVSRDQNEIWRLWTLSISLPGNLSRAKIYKIIQLNLVSEFSGVQNKLVREYSLFFPQYRIPHNFCRVIIGSTLLSMFIFNVLATVRIQLMRKKTDPMVIHDTEHTDSTRFGH